MIANRRLSVAIRDGLIEATSSGREIVVGREVRISPARPRWTDAANRWGSALLATPSRQCSAWPAYASRSTIAEVLDVLRGLARAGGDVSTLSVAICDGLIEVIAQPPRRRIEIASSAKCRFRRNERIIPVGARPLSLHHREAVVVLSLRDPEGRSHVVMAARASRPRHAARDRLVGQTSASSQ